MSVFGKGLEETLEEIDSWSKPCLVIHVNHDDEDETAALCKRSKHLVFLHGKEETIGDLTFTGWGGGGFSRRDKAFEQWAKTLRPVAGRVLMTHAPPYETAIDYQPYMDAHVGCQSYTDAITAFKPVLAIAGHIHECFGEHEERGKTIILNPGPLGVMLELATKGTGDAKPTKGAAKKKTSTKPRGGTA